MLLAAMHRFKHILVDLALDGEEGNLLRWADHLATLADATKVTFIHFWEPVELPSNLREKYPWMLEPGSKPLSQRVEALCEEVLSPPCRERAEIRIEEGDRLRGVLRWARDLSVDLILTHRVDGLSGEQNHACRLARKAPCSVFCVDPTRSAIYESILVTTDFSEHALRALDFGCALARAGKLREVTVFRSFAIPYGQLRSAVSREEFAVEYERFELERLDGYVREHAPDDVTLRPVIQVSPLAADGISRFAAEAGFDVVVLGSRGKHALSALLLGSTVEHVLREVPASVLVIKPKGTGLELIASLLSE